MPWHLSRGPVSFNQWTDKGEESERKPLAFVHTAYISDLLDGNYPRRAAAGAWEGVAHLAGFSLPLHASGTLYSHICLDVMTQFTLSDGVSRCILPRAQWSL